ncbi:serine hydrolase, partial [Mycobacterium tuberculosis]|nr:serine hydrolase [Mycobacterium tuberculosis]
LSLFPTLADLNRDGREAITLSQMLSMSSGLAWNEWRATSLFNNDEFGLFWHTSQAHYVFDRPMAAAAGTQFNYNGGNMAVLALLLVGFTLFVTSRLIRMPMGRAWEALREDEIACRSLG